MSLETHYRLLGLAPGSSLTLVKRAYLREIKIWHPDRYSADSMLRSQAEERTKALTAAYTALTEALRESDHTQGTSESTPEQPAPAEAGPQEKPGSEAQSDATPSIGRWMDRVWQRLRTLWKVSPASPEPASSASAKKGGGQRRAGKPRQPRFDEVLRAARKHPRKPADATLSWRRLAARRARYGRRRGSGGASIKAIKPREPVRPVDPVDRVHPIGKER